MKNIEKYTEQQQAWFRLKGMVILLNSNYYSKEERRERVLEFHQEIKDYWTTYHDKFSYQQMPNSTGTTNI